MFTSQQKISYHTKRYPKDILPYKKISKRYLAIRKDIQKISCHTKRYSKDILQYKRYPKDILPYKKISKRYLAILAIQIKLSIRKTTFNENNSCGFMCPDLLCVYQVMALKRNAPEWQIMIPKSKVLTIWKSSATVASETEAMNSREVSTHRWERWEVNNNKILIRLKLVENWRQHISNPLISSDNTTMKSPFQMTWVHSYYITVEQKKNHVGKIYTNFQWNIPAQQIRNHGEN